MSSKLRLAALIILLSGFVFTVWILLLEKSGYKKRSYELLHRTVLCVVNIIHDVKPMTFNQNSLMIISVLYYLYRCSHEIRYDTCIGLMRPVHLPIT